MVVLMEHSMADRMVCSTVDVTEHLMVGPKVSMMVELMVDWMETMMVE